MDGRRPGRASGGRPRPLTTRPAQRDGDGDGSVVVAGAADGEADAGEGEADAGAEADAGSEADPDGEALPLEEGAAEEPPSWVPGASSSRTVSYTHLTLPTKA